MLPSSIPQPVYCQHQSEQAEVVGASHKNIVLFQEREYSFVILEGHTLGFWERREVWHISAAGSQTVEDMFG